MLFAPRLCLSDNMFNFFWPIGKAVDLFLLHAHKQHTRPNKEHCRQRTNKQPKKKKKKGEERLAQSNGISCWYYSRNVTDDGVNRFVAGMGDGRKNNINAHAADKQHSTKVREKLN